MVDAEGQRQIDILKDRETERQRMCEFWRRVLEIVRFRRMCECWCMREMCEFRRKN